MRVKRVAKPRRPRKKELERVARKYGKIHVKKGDKVKVLAGKDRGKVGKILAVYKTKCRVLVEGVNLVKRHQRPTQQLQKGGIIEKEAPIHISNVQLVDVDGKQTRIRRIRTPEGKSVRMAVKSGEPLDKS